MPDWLTHVLVMYVLLQVVAWYEPRLTPPYIAAGMVGGLLPDIAKLQLILPRSRVEALLGVPFSWQGVSWVWGIVLVVLALSFLVDVKHRKAVIGLLLSGSIVHLLLDGIIHSPGRRPTTLLRPTTYLQLPELYLSSNVWPAVIAVVVSFVVFTLTQWQQCDTET